MTRVKYQKVVVNGDVYFNARIGETGRGIKEDGLVRINL